MAQRARARTADAGQIRRYYEKRRAFAPPARVREDVLTLLEERKALRRTGEALMMAAMPYSGDANLMAAIDQFRAVLDGVPVE